MDDPLPNPLNPPSIADLHAQNIEAKGLRVSEVRKMLDLVVHGSQCGNGASGECGYPHCRKLKKLFQHGVRCETRASGGCVMCQKMWFLIKIHAQTCMLSQSFCAVPRCRELKEYMRKMKEANEKWKGRVMEKILEEENGEVGKIASDAESSTDP